MCSCEPTFTCSKCMPRRDIDLGEWDPKEIAEHAREQQLSSPDFQRHSVAP